VSNTTVTIRVVPDGKFCRTIERSEGERREAIYQRGNDDDLPWSKYPWLKRESWCAARLVSLRIFREDGTVRHAGSNTCERPWFTFGLTPVHLDMEDQ
jgi:hypothetical protein